MSKSSPVILAMILFLSAGLYGCTQQHGAAGVKMRDMESRYAKLEEDYRAVAATGEANRKKLMRAEAEKTELAKEVEELRPAVQERDDLRKERDELRKQLIARTGERDTVQAQLTQFRQDLQALVGRVDAVLTTSSGSADPVTAVPTSRKAE